MSLKGLIISVFQKLKKLSTTLLGIHTQKKCQLKCKNLGYCDRCRPIQKVFFFSGNKKKTDTVFLCICNLQIDGVL